MDQLEALTRAVMERIFIPLEASGRHVHLTEEQIMALFGHGLTEERPLSQPGQFLARERVSLIGPGGEFQNMAVLGPARSRGQAEISLTDGKTLGIRPPIRLSGDVKGTPGCRIRGPAGEITLEEGVICAMRHLHLTPEDGRRLGVQDGQRVRLQTLTARPAVFCDTVVRISPDFRTAAHLDYDEANACGFAPGDLGRILL